MSHCAWNSSGHDGLLKFIEPEVQVKVFLVYHVSIAIGISIGLDIYFGIDVVIFVLLSEQCV